VRLTLANAVLFAAVVFAAVLPPCNESAQHAAAYLRARGLTPVACDEPAKSSSDLVTCQAGNQHFRCVAPKESEVACEVETFGSAPLAERPAP